MLEGFDNLGASAIIFTFEVLKCVLILVYSMDYS